MFAFINERKIKHTRASTQNTLQTNVKIRFPFVFYLWVWHCDCCAFSLVILSYMASTEINWCDSEQTSLFAKKKIKWKEYGKDRSIKFHLGSLCHSEYENDVNKVQYTVNGIQYNTIMFVACVDIK